MPETALPRVAILISGRGSNMRSLLSAMRAGTVAAEPAIVISNVPGAAGLAAAAEQGVETAVVDHTVVKPREAHEREILALLSARKIRFICLAGYMRRLSPSFVTAYKDRILNVHPALLPAFPGLDAQQAALAYGVKVAGCTVHLVDAEVDHGPIVLQASVPVFDDDSQESLSARILAVEHTVYPRALHLLATGRLEIAGRSVRILA